MVTERDTILHRNGLLELTPFPFTPHTLVVIVYLLLYFNVPCHGQKHQIRQNCVPQSHRRKSAKQYTHYTKNSETHSSRS